MRYTILQPQAACKLSTPITCTCRQAMTRPQRGKQSCTHQQKQNTRALQSPKPKPKTSAPTRRIVAPSLLVTTHTHQAVACPSLTEPNPTQTLDACGKPSSNRGLINVQGWIHASIKKCASYGDLRGLLFIRIARFAGFWASARPGQPPLHRTVPSVPHKKAGYNVNSCRIREFVFKNTMVAIQSWSAGPLP